LALEVLVRAKGERATDQNDHIEADAEASSVTSTTAGTGASGCVGLGGWVTCLYFAEKDSSVSM